MLKMLVLRRCRRANTCLAVGLVTGLQTPLLAQQAPDFATSQLVIETQSDWESWKYATGTLSIVDGEVQPHRLSRNTNAMLDIAPFLQARPPDGLKKEPADITVEDGIQGGSNVAGVVNVLDGDMGTYWEPDAPVSGRELATQWWFTVDLGRAIIANKIVGRFVDEELGDPFILFDVLVSDGVAPATAPSSGLVQYTTVIQTLRPNRTQRVFEADFSEVDTDARAQVVRYVQVVVLESDLERGKQVSIKEEYDQLPAAEQGLIEYNKRLDDTRETPVSESVFLRLDMENRGGVYYFQRRHPRLAELEVWSEGEDLVAGSVARGGGLSSSMVNTDISRVFDGDANSLTGLSANRPPELGFGEFVIDLGSVYWINQHQMIISYLPGGHTRPCSATTVLRSQMVRENRMAI
jgi:hypothetical protein